MTVLFQHYPSSVLYGDASSSGLPVLSATVEQATAQRRRRRAVGAASTYTFPLSTTAVVAASKGGNSTAGQYNCLMVEAATALNTDVKWSADNCRPATAQEIDGASRVMCECSVGISPRCQRQNQACQNPWTTTQPVGGFVASAGSPVIKAHCCC